MTVYSFLMGGLGNQLFQVFNTIAYAIRHNQSFRFPYSKTLKTGVERSTYWDSLLKHIKQYTCMTLPRVPVYKEPYYHYKVIPSTNDSCMMYGYFQSYKYFEDVQTTIYDIIHLREIQKEIQQVHTLDYMNTASVHFRIGDYASKQHYHPVMTLEYYKNAIDALIQDTNVNNWNILYFYQREDQLMVTNMIQKLKDIYPMMRFTPIDHVIEDWKQMLMMSNCRHNIIANSSFSWWGAYMNHHKDTHVYYPSIWFGPAANNNTKDLCPPQWKQINVS